MSVNKAILVGRLGQDPELRYTPSGAPVCNFSVATSESWVDKAGQKQEKTEWHRIVVWGKLAELCNQYLTKGRQAYIEGSLQTRSWEDSNSGQKKYTTEINARTVQFLGGQASAGAQNTTSIEQAGDRGEGKDANYENTGAMDGNYQVSTDANFTTDDIPF